MSCSQSIGGLPPVCEPGLCAINTATYCCVNCGARYSSPQERAQHLHDVRDELDRIERNWPSAIR